MTRWKFKTKNFVVSYRTLKEPFDSFYMEPSLIEECKAKIKSGEWSCFTAAIEVRHIPTGEALATEYLGQCIYADPMEFIDHRGGVGYFKDMVNEACKEARRNLAVKRQEARTNLENVMKGAAK